MKEEGRAGPARRDCAVITHYPPTPSRARMRSTTDDPCHDSELCESPVEFDFQCKLNKRPNGWNAEDVDGGSPCDCLWENADTQRRSRGGSH